MELDFTSEERRFRDELREYIGELMTDELVAELSVQREGGGPEFRKAMKKMGYVDSTTMNATTHQIQFMRNAVNKKWLEYDGFLRLLAKIASSFQVPFKKVASDFTTRCTINTQVACGGNNDGMPKLRVDKDTIDDLGTETVWCQAF